MSTQDAPESNLAATLVAPVSVSGMAPRPGPPSTGLRYVLRDEIGRGGMGVVELWNDPHIGRDVAAKILLGDAEEQQTRFLHEARTQGRLEHPSIVPVYDLSTLPDGRPFFTMKRVNGVTLASIFVARSSQSAEDAAKYSLRKLLAALAQVALAIDFAHQRGFLHRDLKPANLMLGNFGEVYVLDWGIARLVAEPELVSLRASLAEVPTGLTADGVMLGTPGYMPPEQARGALGELDARADVYALGCILFEILAGEPLHRGATTAALIANTLSAEPITASERTGRADIPPELDALALTATAAGREDRLGSARDFAETIERFLDGDRDLALRVRAAEAHASDAERLSRTALGQSAEGEPTPSSEQAEEARRQALREVGRAVALSPEHPGALRTLASLLTDPPRVLPAEVEAELNALESAHVRVGGRTGALAYGAGFSVLFVLTALGRIPFGDQVLVSLVLFGACAAASFASSRSGRPSRSHSVAMLVLSTVALGSLAGLFGPLVIAPMAVAINTMLFVVSNGRAVRGLVIVTGAIGAVGPLVLEGLAILPPSFRFEDGMLILLPRALPLEPASLIVLGITFAATVVLGALALVPFRDDLDDAQRRSRVLAWQLRQFVPVDAERGATTKPPPAK